MKMLLKLSLTMVVLFIPTFASFLFAAVGRAKDNVIGALAIACIAIFLTGAVSLILSIWI